MTVRCHLTQATVHHVDSNHRSPAIHSVPICSQVPASTAMCFGDHGIHRITGSRVWGHTEAWNREKKNSYHESLHRVTLGLLNCDQSPPCVRHIRGRLRRMPGVHSPRLDRFLGPGALFRRNLGRRSSSLCFRTCLALGGGFGVTLLDRFRLHGRQLRAVGKQLFDQPALIGDGGILLYH